MGTSSSQMTILTNFMKKDNLLDLMKSKKTIFTSNDISLLWGNSDIDFVKKKIYRYLKAGKMYSVRRGIYAKDQNYNKYELATKIYTPSYISFETVLAKAGIIFQLYGQIFIASYLTREIIIDGQTYSFRKIKNSILINQMGIEVEDTYFTASPERAFLDVVYLNKEYHFDNLVNIDWNKVNKILPIYNNRRMEKKVKEYQNATQRGLN